MASYRRKYWHCKNKSCDTWKGCKSFRTCWWHTWIDHKQFLCIHCEEVSDTFEDYDNHLSQHNDSDEATERGQSSIGTSDPTEQPSTSNPTENVPAADRWSPFAEILMTDEMQDWLLYGFTVADVQNLNEKENVPAADRRSPSAEIPITDERQECFSYGFTVEEVQKVNEPHDCGYSPNSGFSPVISASKSSAIDKSKKIICTFPTCNWRNIEWELSMHIGVVHLPQKDSDSRLICMVCKLTLKEFVELWWHYLKVHREYSCHECNDLFSPVDTYYEHRLAHKNNKIVGKDQHELEPIQIGQFFFCPYAFCRIKGNKKAVKVHIRNLHVTRKLKQCCKCNIGNCENLWFHYWNIHQVLVCEFCQLYFETYMSYTGHRETYHRSEMQVPSRRRDASTCDVNVGASTSEGPPRKLQKPF